MMEAEERYEEGLRLAAEGDLQQAFAAFEKAVELNPNHGAACKELAKLSLQANERRAFSNWCHEAMRLDEQDPEPHLMMAEALAEAKRWDEASDELRLARRVRALDAKQSRWADVISDRVRRACDPGKPVLE